MDTETEYLGWEEDLRAQHGVVHPNLREGEREKWFWCELCHVQMPLFAQVPYHVKGKTHKKRAGAAPAPPAPGGAVAFVRAAAPAAPVAALDTEGWLPLLRYAHAGKI